MFNQYGLLEVDGPPRGYFEWESDGKFERVQYKTLGVYGDDPVLVVAKLAQVIETVRGMLMSVPAEDHVIWWRARPSIEERLDFDELDFPNIDGWDRESMRADYERNNPARFFSRCRLATTPDLPPELWAQIQKPEGGLPPPGLILSKAQENKNASQASHAPHKAHPPHLTVAGGRGFISPSAVIASAIKAASTYSEI